MIIDFIYDHMVHPIMEPLIVLMQSSNNHCLNNLSNIEREREDVLSQMKISAI